MDKKFAIVSSVAMTALFGVLIYFAYFNSSQSACANTRVAGEDLIGGPFELTKHTGETVTEQDVIQGLTLVYFGFTFCPDFCPLDLSRNLTAIDIAQTRDVDVTPVFISIDPARDTVDVVSDYVSAYDSRLVGLTGTAEQVDAIAKAYRVFYRKNGEGDQDYLVDHSTHSYLMDENGFLNFFRTDTSPESVADALVCFANS